MLNVIYLKNILDKNNTCLKIILLLIHVITLIFIKQDTYKAFLYIGIHEDNWWWPKTKFLSFKAVLINQYFVCCFKRILEYFSKSFLFSLMPTSKQWEHESGIVYKHWPETFEFITQAVELWNRWIRLSCYYKKV